MHPDHEILEVEERIARRRAAVAQLAGESKRSALRKLGSPAALIGGVALGFIIGGGVSRRHREPPHPERRKEDHLKAAKATGIAGMLMTGAMWFIKARFGTPWAAAEYVLSKVKKQDSQDSQRPSPQPDAAFTRSPTQYKQAANQ